MDSRGSTSLDRADSAREAQAANPPGRHAGARETSLVRELANQAFSRASGAPLRAGNSVRLLKDAAENYAAWLGGIRSATRTIHFEMYIVHEDAQGKRFADALIDRARDGVRVRVLYDWLGGLGKTSPGFWRRLRDAGVEVRCYNPPRFDRPFGWISRDHRKVIVVDRTVAFVTGLCVGQAWVGDVERGVAPWRDTGLELRGPAVDDCEDAFADAWATAGDALPADPHGETVPAPSTGDISLRVVATVPNSAGLFRADQLVAAVAQHSLWLTDAYFAGTAAYVEALCAAAKDDVDVRLLVPGSSDLPVLRLASRAGYRPLLEAGVRVFEWNGPMLHAKTAVADRRWARVGSTNLNIASWLGNRELDVIVENEGFAQQMEAMFLDDLRNATEVVLDKKNRVRVPGAPAAQSRRAPHSGSGGRAVAGAVRIGNAVTAAITNRRVLEPVEAHIALLAGIALLALAVAAVRFPRGFAYPFAVFSGWLAVSLVFRGISLRRAHAARSGSHDHAASGDRGDAGRGESA